MGEYFSDIKFFRDLNKNPDIYNIPGQALSREEKDEIAKEQARKNSKLKKQNGLSPKESDIESDNSLEDLTNSARNYLIVVDQIRELTLKPEFADDKKEKEILQQRKDFALNLLQKVLRDAGEYAASVSTFNLIFGNQRQDDLDKYQDDMKLCDEERRAAHNALINDLKILIRFIDVNFNAKCSDKARLDFEKKSPVRAGLKEEEIAEALNKRNYINFAQENFVISKMPTDPKNERDYIRDWSFDIYAELSRLNDYLQTTLKK